MFNEKKLISFDFNGTLCPNAGDMHLFEEKLQQVIMERYGLDNLTREKRKEIKNEVSKDVWKEIKDIAKEYWAREFFIPPKMKEYLMEPPEKHKVVIFSNSSRNHVRETLEKNRVSLSKIDNIYTTKDFEGKMKKESWMYEKISGFEKVPCKNCIHIGDNQKQDYREPLKAGFTAFLIDHNEAKRISSDQIKDL